MNNLTRVRVTASADGAIKKLKKAKIAVYDCRKEGVDFTFSVKDKQIKKVFAIFSKPCYNIREERVSPLKGFLRLALLRAGLIVGAAAFVAVSAVSNLFVLKIEVTGSGKYLEPEIRRIIAEGGGREFSTFSGFDNALATGRILSLPQVTFCNIRKNGSVLSVDVRVDGEQSGAVNRYPLVSDVDGRVKNVVVICGTAAVSAGDEVKAGDSLIYPFVTSGESKIESIAAGYCEIERKTEKQYFALRESEQSLAEAYASALDGGDEVISRSYAVKPAEGGVIYIIKFTCLHKLSINLS